MSLSRRQFLTGIGAAGLATGAASLAGCAPKPAAVDAAKETAAAASDVIAAAELNPQDYDYRSADSELSTLFSPWKLGPIELNHRMVKSAAGSATYLAGLTDELFQYYVNFAKGGVEMIWVEGEVIEGGVISDELKAFGKKLSDEVKKYGSHLGYQWAHMGVDPSTLSVDDILKIEDEGVAIAQGLKDMGFEAIEINAAGFNMGEKFLSRAYNTRTDEYGAASFENRARFVTESIEKIKEACGEDFVVQVLMDCIEDNDNLTNNATLMNLDNTITAPHNTVTTVEEGIELAKLFEAAGCDSLHLRLGPLGNHPCQFGSDLYFILNGIEGATGYGTQYDFNRHWQGQLIGNHSGAGMLLDVVARYKEAVSIPCGTVTYMDPAHAPDYFEQALADGKADFYMMTRPLTVDTEYVNKLRDGRRDEIAPCTRCLHCHIGSNQMNATMGYCRVNALTQRVMREGGPATYELPAAETVKNVMVVGAGPAGMEAARIAAARGHKVTLYEKGSSVGGRLEFASNVKGPHENLDDFSAYLQRQLEITGVELVTDKEVDASLVESVAPDALVIATGGLRDTLEVPGAADGLVIDFEQFMTADLGENVVVWGSNAQAFDAALWLTVHKKNVTMVTPSANADLDKQQSQHAMRFMTTALYALGLNVYPSASIKEAREGEIVVATETGTEVTVACDAIVNGADMLPDSSLKDATSVAETYVIGDAAEPFNIAMAIRGGNDVGRAL